MERIFYDAILISASPLNGYVAMLKPRAPDATHPVRNIVYKNPWRTTTKAAAVIDPWPDHNVFLAAKTMELRDWAQKTFDTKTASHIAHFLVSGNIADVAPLTDIERIKLRNKMAEVNDKYEQKIATIEESLPR